jgi:hypothetical protein
MSRWVAFILALATGIGVNLIIVAGITKIALNHGHWDVSDNYVTLVQTTLGMMIGALATYLGTGNHCNCSCHQDHQRDETP